MRPDPADIRKLIDLALSDLREDLSLPVMEGTDARTPILGNGSGLDSMAVVQLIVDLEGRLQERYGLNWILADERALSRSRSPFRTVGDLTEFIVETTPEA